MNLVSISRISKGMVISRSLKCFASFDSTNVKWYSLSNFYFSQKLKYLHPNYITLAFKCAQQNWSGRRHCVCLRIHRLRDSSRHRCGTGRWLRRPWCSTRSSRCEERPPGSKVPLPSHDALLLFRHWCHSLKIPSFSYLLISSFNKHVLSTQISPSFCRNYDK